MNSYLAQQTFPIIGLVTTLSLILAFLSNRKPIHKFRLETRKLFWVLPAKETLIFLYCLSFFLILSPYLLDILRSYKIFDLKNHNTYTDLANKTGALLLFISLFDTILISFFTTAKYSRHNFKKFFQSSSGIILEGNEDDLASFGKELKLSFKKIIESAGKYDKFAAYRKEKDNQAYVVPEMTSYSLELLNILSDSRFCKIFVTRCSSSFFYLVDEIQKNSLYRGGGYSFVRNLFEQAFLLEDSAIHREKDFDGYGHYKDFTKLVFGNSNFLFSFTIFSAFPNYYEKPLHYWQVKKFSDCLEIAITSSINNRRHEWGYLLHAFSKIESWTLSSIVQIGKDKNADYSSEAALVLRECSKSLREVLEVLAKFSDKLPDLEKDEELLKKRRFQNIYMIVAEAISDFLGTISHKDSNDEFYRNYSIDLWLSLFSRDKDNKALAAVGKCLEFLIFRGELQGVEEQFLKGWYKGTIIKSILTISFPYCKPATKKTSETEIIEDRVLFKAHQILYKHFVKKYEENQEFALAHIPKHIEYDDQNQALKMKDWNGKYRVFELTNNKDMEETDS